MKGIKDITIIDRGDAYMPMVNPAHKIPTTVSRTLPGVARKVTAITNPRNPTFNKATNFNVLTCIHTFALLNKKLLRIDAFEYTIH